jgi:hypothetical protein
MAVDSSVAPITGAAFAAPWDIMFRRPVWTSSTQPSPCVALRTTTSAAGTRR